MWSGLKGPADSPVRPNLPLERGKGRGDLLGRIGLGPNGRYAPIDVKPVPSGPCYGVDKGTVFPLSPIPAGRIT